MTSRRATKARAAVVALAAIATLAGCGGDGGGGRGDDALPGATSGGSLRLGDVTYDVVNVDCATLPTGLRQGVVQGRHDDRILEIDLRQRAGADEGDLSGFFLDAGVAGAGVFTDDDWSGFDDDRIAFTGAARISGGPDADDTGTLSVEAECPADDSPGGGTITVDGTTVDVNTASCSFGSGYASVSAVLVDESDDDESTHLFVSAGRGSERIEAEVPGKDDVAYEQSLLSDDGVLEAWEPADRVEREWQVPDGPVVAAAVDCGLMRRLP